MSEVKIRVFLCVRVCVHACGGQRSRSGVISPALPTYLVEIGPLSHVELAEDSRLAGQVAPGICQALSHQH